MYQRWKILLNRSSSWVAWSFEIKPTKSRRKYPNECIVYAKLLRWTCYYIIVCIYIVIVYVLPTGILYSCISRYLSIYLFFVHILYKHHNKFVSQNSFKFCQLCIVDIRVFFIFYNLILSSISQFYCTKIIFYLINF